MQKFANVTNLNFRFNKHLSMNKKFIDQIQIILIVQNSKKMKNRKNTMTYCEILIKLLRFQNHNIDKTMNIFNLQFWINTIVKNSKLLNAIKFYVMSFVLRNVHVMFNDRDEYYVNNYIDWNIYNTIYNFDFYDDNIRKIKIYRKFHRFE